jgi:hypothetical protein
MSSWLDVEAPQFAQVATLHPFSPTLARCPATAGLWYLLQGLGSLGWSGCWFRSEGLASGLALGLRLDFIFWVWVRSGCLGQSLDPSNCRPSWSSVSRGRGVTSSHGAAIAACAATAAPVVVPFPSRSTRGRVVVFLPTSPRVATTKRPIFVAPTPAKFDNLPW